MKRFLCGATGLGLLLAAAFVTPTSARPWRADPKGQAMEYSQIIDQRGPGEIVLIMWMSPVAVADRAGAAQVWEILSEYMVVGIVHMKVGADGNPTFQKIPPVSIEPDHAASQPPIDATVLPPALVGTITTLQTFMQRSLGAMGRGVEWFVFEGKDVQSCGKGGFAVPYDGVRYTYETPIPGCPEA